MKILLRNLILSICCLLLSSRLMANTADDIILSFRNSLGFSFLEEEDSIILNCDSLLEVLEKHNQYDYFEFERILIKSQILRGQTRMAIAQSDVMYSKAKAQDNLLGMALALNAIAEVFIATGRHDEAAEVYERSLELFEQYDGDIALKKILLVELAEYYLHIKNMDAMSKYIRMLEKCSSDKWSDTEHAVINIFKIYYNIYAGKSEASGRYLSEVEKIKNKLIPELYQYYLVAKAFYLKRTDRPEEALKVYNRFFSMERANNDYSLFISALHSKAELLEEMGHKKESFDLYDTIYSYINSVFKANYPKEIDQLSIRFQADQLTYQIEQARSESLRYYTISIIGCVFVLFLFIFLSWRKIFRLNQSKKKLEITRVKAEDAIRKKNLFLSNMSHEVRTPLNAIVGFSTLMASDEMEVDETSRKEFCEIIKVNSYQLLKLINDIIDFSDFDEDNISMNIKEYDAVKICREVIETIAASYKLEVELRFVTSLETLAIETDDARLRQVLINLLVNATKFTKEGSIVLSLDRSCENADMALFSVTDTGCGIPVEKQKLIFERFEKLNDFVQGTGLGLSICLLIMRHLKGRIWIDATYLQGARFCFLHPLKQIENPQTTKS